MRWLLLLALVACDGKGKCPEGNVCTPTFPDAAVPDGESSVCGPTFGCQSGPRCGEICCEFGERCEGGICMCGDKVCVAGDSCLTPGPAVPTNCGSICCGVSGPCPI